MIQFNTLEFVNAKTLRIDISVMDLAYYTNVYIGKILIDTEDTVLSTCPSENPPLVIEPSGQGLKSYKQAIDVSSIVDKGAKMLFVYVECLGVPAPNTPCGMDSEYSMKPVVDYECIYKEGLKKAKCVGKCGCLDGNCSIDTAFANFSLQYFRLVSALENDDVETAYDAWYYLSHRGGKKRLNPVQLTKPCGCNG